MYALFSFSLSRRCVVILMTRSRSINNSRRTNGTVSFFQTTGTDVTIYWWRVRIACEKILYFYSTRRFYLDSIHEQVAEQENMTVIIILRCHGWCVSALGAENRNRHDHEITDRDSNEIINYLFSSFSKGNNRFESVWFSQDHMVRDSEWRSRGQIGGTGASNWAGNILQSTFAEYYCPQSGTADADQPNFGQHGHSWHHNIIILPGDVHLPGFLSKFRTRRNRMQYGGLFTR